MGIANISSTFLDPVSNEAIIITKIEIIKKVFLKKPLFILLYNKKLKIITLIHQTTLEMFRSLIRENQLHYRIYRKKLMIS